ncbi:protein SPO16 homolog isoform X2 [Manacus candei]|uniref:protein SPO16 homolog isoform X2 n=1 Tax=Manacus candei TaxID=415023 RepID=UPI002227A786|nr:protein SPO16 homolog isoform X2 [Manacus candei]
MVIRSQSRCTPWSSGGGKAAAAPPHLTPALFRACVFSDGVTWDLTAEPVKKMTESCGQEQTRWITTVIMSTALQDHEISTILQRQHHRVRYSESVETGSVIFPLSGVAFILSDTQDLLRTGEEQFSERIQKFIGIHRNSFLVLSAALHGSEEWNVMFRIQKRFLGSNLRVIPVHNPAETVKLMLTMAKESSVRSSDSTYHQSAGCHYILSY